ncbi:Integrase core domain protein [Rickettsiales bacterium Ac37b]|nr:Integrase core domain protein [Rickettsiales bacterium Ac37b]
MGQILHGCATTTHAIRKELQRSQATIKELSEQYNINPKTVIKWRQRKEEGVEDRSNAPKKATTILKPEDEALIIAFRKSTQLPLDDCFDALIKEIPYLTRSNLYRCLKRYGLSCLPKEDNIKEKKKFKAYEIGFMHLDITEVRIGEGKFYIFVAICRVSKFAYVELHNNSNGDTTVNFLDNLVSSCPFKIHTILTDNGVQFAYNGLARYRAPKARHRFDLKCKDYGIRHRTTRPYSPSTNGQVERMNRTIKEATTKKYHYTSREELDSHLQAFVMAYNYAKRLSSIARKTPFEMILTCYTQNANNFRINPNHQLLKPYI